MTDFEFWYAKYAKCEGFDRKCLERFEVVNSELISTQVFDTLSKIEGEQSYNLWQFCSQFTFDTFR